MNKYSTCGNKLFRGLWELARLLLFRPFPGRIFLPWRAFLLRLFGAELAQGAHIYATARIRDPRNLVMAEGSCLADGVICYNVDQIVIGRHATVSQRCFLCTASHDIDSPGHELITAPIRIGDFAWVAAEAYIGKGVDIGNGAVVGARAAVFRTVPPKAVVGGNPAVFIRNRKITS